MHKIKSALQKKWATATELLLKWKISVGLLAFGWSVLVGTELPACCQTILAIQPYNWIARALRCIQVLGLLCQIGCASTWLQHVCHLRFEQKYPGGQQESQPGRVWQSSVFPIASAGKTGSWVSRHLSSLALSQSSRVLPWEGCHVASGKDNNSKKASQANGSKTMEATSSDFSARTSLHSVLISSQLSIPKDSFLDFFLLQLRHWDREGSPSAIRPDNFPSSHSCLAKRYHPKTQCPPSFPKTTGSESLSSRQLIHELFKHKGKRKGCNCRCQTHTWLWNSTGQARKFHEQVPHKVSSAVRSVSTLKRLSVCSTCMNKHRMSCYRWLDVVWCVCVCSGWRDYVSNQQLELSKWVCYSMSLRSIPVLGNIRCTDCAVCLSDA